MSLERQLVFTLFGLPVTATVVTTWGMVAVLSAMAIWAGRSVRERPPFWQIAAEWGLTGLDEMLSELTGGSGRRFVPLVATLAIFIVVANELAVLPFVESPTADLNTPLALAVIVFFSVHVFGVRALGLWGYLKQFGEPIPLLLPFNVLHQFSRTLSLAIRLFGNMLSHQLIAAVLLLLLPLLVPTVLQLFGLFIGILQAYIFVVLTAVYVAGAVRVEGGA